MKIEKYSHPVGLVGNIAGTYGDDLMLSFSTYFYRPSQVLDERMVFEEDIRKISSDWVSEIISGLNDEWELALNSCVTDGRGRKRHLGMIDFVGRPPIPVIRERARKFLGARMAAGLIFFDSGRSIHGYSISLMGPREWHQFLGRLLLMNDPSEPPVVDTRWIGHRLLGGYSALRWSANSSRHDMVPKLIK